MARPACRRGSPSSTPPWNFPVAIPAGSVLAALAAGSGVIIKPAPLAKRSAAVMVEALWEAGCRARCSRSSTSRRASSGVARRASRGRPRHPHRRVGDRGAVPLVAPDLPLVAETSGKNAIIVTPSADLDLAVADVVRSAFGHAGQKCSAASLVILVGSVAQSERFRRQLEDAVRTLRVGWPQDPTHPDGADHRAARTASCSTRSPTCSSGETWLVKPRQLDETGRLWSPGVRDGVAPGQRVPPHRVLRPGARHHDRADARCCDRRCRTPSPYGLTAGIHSLDPVEVEHWLDRVQAGNLYVNRGITGAIVRRQPFGGWKRSSVGTVAKAGGPNYRHVARRLAAGRERATREPACSTGCRRRSSSVVTLGQPAMDFAEFDRVRRAARSDQQAWDAGVRRRARRVRARGRAQRVPVPAAAGHHPPVGGRAARRTSCDCSRRRPAPERPCESSTAVPLPTPLVQSFDVFAPLVRGRGRSCRVGRALGSREPQPASSRGRVRLVGGDAAALAAAVGGDPDVAIWSGPVTTAGRVELLPFLREQAVSITAHRFGNPDRGHVSARS